MVLLLFDLILARQHHLLLRLCRLQRVRGEALDSSEDSLVVFLLLHVLGCWQHILLSWIRWLQFEVTSKELPVQQMYTDECKLLLQHIIIVISIIMIHVVIKLPFQAVSNEHFLGKFLDGGGGSGHPDI